MLISGLYSDSVKIVDGHWSIKDSGLGYADFRAVLSKVKCENRVTKMKERLLEFFSFVSSKQTKRQK